MTRLQGSRPRLLCVDDEPEVLEGVRDLLRDSFDVHVATGGPEALELLSHSSGAFAVLISDMRMPGMSGAVVLREARRIAPSTVRMLLTGFADSEAAARAVNDGQIFRFLTKPCPGEQLRAACVAAVARHRMVAAEQVVLEHAVHDTVDVLIDLLVPDALAAGARLHEALVRLGQETGRRDTHAELAAKLFHLGALPQLTYLERTCRILAAQARRFDSRTNESPVPRGARMLRIAADHARLRRDGWEPAAAVTAMRADEGVYDPELLDAFARTLR